jgi:arylformamidase
MVVSYKEVLDSLRKLKVYDLSPLFETNMPMWPTHPSMGIIADARNFDQNGYAAQTLVISEHTGSHVDAPAHVLRSMSNVTIDTYPVDKLIGVYKKYDLAAYKFKPGELVQLETIKTVEREEKIMPDPEDIILIDFGWDQYYRPNSKDPSERAWWAANAPGLSEEVCRYFSNARIRAIGSDTAGCEIAIVDGLEQSGSGHEKYFLPNHILIIEGLRGLSATPNVGIFIALPLKIKKGTGSPIRPILLA